MTHENAELQSQFEKLFDGVLIIENQSIIRPSNSIHTHIYPRQIETYFYTNIWT